MRYLQTGILAALVLAVSVTTGSAGAEETRPYTQTADFGHLFAAEAPVSLKFAAGEVALDAGAQRRLDRQAAWIAAHEKLRIRVYGISDQTGYQPRNMAIAMKRANAVVQYLESKGIDPARISGLVLFGNAPQPRFADAGASTVTEVLGWPGRTIGDAGASR